MAYNEDLLSDKGRVWTNCEEGDSEESLSIFWITSWFQKAQNPFKTVPLFKALKGKNYLISQSFHLWPWIMLWFAKIKESNRLILMADGMKQDFLHLVLVHNSIHTVSVKPLWYLFVYLSSHLIFSVVSVGKIQTQVILEIWGVWMCLSVCFWFSLTLINVCYCNKFFYGAALSLHGLWAINGRIFDTK